MIDNHPPEQPLVINGRTYPMWSQLVQRAHEWVGGTLEDSGDDMDRAIGGADGPMSTKITGIELRPNGGDSAFFAVQGEDFECGFDVAYGGITAGEQGWLTFRGYGGHKWRIKTP